MVSWPSPANGRRVLNHIVHFSSLIQHQEDSHTGVLLLFLYSSNFKGRTNNNLIKKLSQAARPS